MQSIKRDIFSILIFSLVFIVFSYPLCLGVNRYISGTNTTDEPFALSAYLWLVKHCILNKIPLERCDFLAYPFGMDISGNLGSVYLWEFIKNKLTLITNHIISFNILVILSFIL